LTSVTAGVVSKTCKDKSDCSEAGEACTTSADCCGGLTCPAGGGLCLNVGGSLYEKQTYTREYVASCPVGTRVKWQNLEWQGVFPANTEIQFSVQTKAKAADTYLPMTATLLKKANTTTTAGMWDSKNVDGVLANATPPQPSLNYLLVTMEFRPNSGGTSAPALTNWRQIYDCLPNE
jgi:hypothetical protein